MCSCYNSSQIKEKMLKSGHGTSNPMDDPVYKEDTVDLKAGLVYKAVSCRNVFTLWHFK